MEIGRTVAPDRPTVDVIRQPADVGHELGVRVAPVNLVARCLVMITAAAFAILVLLPAVVAAQATVRL